MMEIGRVKGILCFGLKWEARCILGELPSYLHWRVIVTGPGAQGIEEKISGLLSGGHVQYILSCGFAAGLNPTLGAGTVVCFSTDEKLLAIMKDAGAVPGSFVSVPSPLYSVDAKRELYRKLGVDIADMESEILRRIALDHNSTFGVVRVVLDDASQNIWPILFECLDARGAIGYFKLTKWLFTHPHAVPEFLRLATVAKEARATLGRVLRKLISELG